MKQSHLDLIILFLAECIGTGLLLFIGCLGTLETSQGPPTQLSASLGFGLAVMIIINIFGMVSGAHLNPSVTLGAFIYKFLNIPVSLKFEHQTYSSRKKSLTFLSDENYRQQSSTFLHNCLEATWAMDFSECCSRTLTMKYAPLNLQSIQSKHLDLSSWSRLYFWWSIVVSLIREMNITKVRITSSR